MAMLRYRIDAQDRITELLEGWPSSAAGSEWQSWLGRELWSCISDSTTREVYRALVAAARRRGAVRVPYRCDTGRHRRWFEMAILAGGGGAVEFASVLLRAEARELVPLLEPAVPRHGRFIRMCSWCQDIRLPDGRWCPVEQAARQDRMLEDDTLPQITHGICEPCADRLRRQLEEL